MTQDEAQAEARRRWGALGRAYRRDSRSAPYGVGVFGGVVFDADGVVHQPVGWGPTWEIALERAGCLETLEVRRRRTRRPRGFRYGPKDRRGVPDEGEDDGE